MICVYCNTPKTSITNSRSTKSHTQTWRRHYCQACKRTFTTFEKADMKHLAVKTKDKLSPYSRSKLQLSIIRSFQDTSLDYQLIDTLTDTVEIKLLKLANLTLDVHIISEIVMNTLKAIDKKAYLHYLAAHTN